MPLNDSGKKSMRDEMEVLMKCQIVEYGSRLMLSAFTGEGGGVGQGGRGGPGGGLGLGPC